jgi:hypothetical protein
LHQNRRIGALSGSITVFGVLVLLAIIKFRKQILVKEAELWDLETVTAADYTCEVQLSQKVCMEIAKVTAK